MPEAQQTEKTANAVRGRMRRLDIEDVLGKLPTPEVPAGMHLVGILFQLGPIRGELPLCEGDLESWERRRGIELAPWQAELIVSLSQAYMTEMHAAKSPSALCPWTLGRNVWKYVMDKKHEQQPKEQAPDGNRKRRRNPPPG